jgi:hypothetical protein
VASSTGGLALRWGAVQYGAMVECFRLRSSESWVDVCLLEVNGRWIATAETPDGPTLGTGTSSLEALWGAFVTSSVSYSRRWTSKSRAESDRQAMRHVEEVAANFASALAAGDFDRALARGRLRAS